MKKSLLTIFAISFFAISASAATITGTVTYDGEIPKFKEIKMDADPVCLTKHGEEVYPQTLVIGNEETKTMGNVFVHVKSGLPKGDYPVPTEPHVLDQKGCVYTPHVSGVMVGQPVKFLNPDGTLHNVHAIPKVNDEFNMAMPKFRTEVTKVFDKKEFMFPIKCDVHPWMISWLAVMDHPHFFTTAPDGKYTLADLPDGQYVIEAWHEKLGPQTKTVTIADGQDQAVDFVFSRPDK